MPTSTVNLKRSFFTLLLILMTGILTPGCQPDEQAENPSTQTPNETTSPSQITENDVEESQKKETPTSTSASVEKTNFEREGITAKVATWEQIQEFIKGQKGKIVVVDIWSTWCFPCVKELPHLIALQKKYPEKIVCVSVNINYDGSETSPPESNAEEIMDFLVEKQAKIHNFISSTSDEELYEKIDLASIPVAYVYDAEGALTKRFDNEKQEYGDDGFNYEKHITPLVEQMLKETAK